MGVVTMTGHLGSRTPEIAALVARELGYEMIARDLILQAADSLGWSEEAADAFDERTGTLGERLKRLLAGIVDGPVFADPDLFGSIPPEAVWQRTYAEGADPAMRPDDRRYIETLKRLVNALADRGNVVIVGRGGQAILAGRAGTLHVRIASDIEVRARFIAERDGIAPTVARRRIEDSDRQREGWHRKYFGFDYRSPYLYHLVLNSGWLRDEHAAGLVVHAARDLAEAQAAVDAPARN